MLPVPSPTRRAIDRLPTHLQRYVADQDYGAYTPRDHAVWRHILHRLTNRLKDTAHGSYLAGLAATGIGLERIPSLDEMNLKLEGLGWSAVGVRGFIPPAVFTELQSLGVLAIAADIRSHEHIEYTPAPDIVHESAGHAPIIANARYAQYLKRCGLVGFKAIASAELNEEMSGDSLARQFEQLEYHGSSDQQLLELKAKMGVLGAGTTEAPKQIGQGGSGADAK